MRILGGVLGALALAGAGIFAISRGESAPLPTSGPALVVSPSPTVGLIDSYFASRQPSPKPSSAQPSPAFTTWSATQISAAQDDALRKGTVLLADTWTDRNAVAIDVLNSQGAMAVGVNGLAAGATFDVPIGGVVDSVAVGVGQNFKDRVVYLRTMQFMVAFLFPFESEILVKNEDRLLVGGPLARLDGGVLPKGTGTSSEAQVLIVNGTNPITPVITIRNLLADAAGRIVKLAR